MSKTDKTPLPQDDPSLEAVNAELAEIEEKDAAADIPAPGEQVESPTLPLPPPKKDLKAFLRTTKGRVIVISAAVILVLAVLFAMPATRYAIAGLVVKKDLAVTVTDALSGKPVSKAEVIIGGRTVTTDSKGEARLAGVAVGDYSVVVKKKYYRDETYKINVPILRAPDQATLRLTATGRRVPITVLNKISGQPLAKVTITASESAAITNEKGEATLVLPAGETQLTATLKADAFNQLQADVKVTDQPDAQNTFRLIPAGTVYFLSKRTGKIDVMKSDLDGGNASQVVAGTGKEEEGGTVLLAARDWQHLALLAKRDSDQAKLYMVDAATGKLSVMDEGNATFTPIGWDNNYFIYSVDRNVKSAWDNKREALKSYNAKTGKLTTLDETIGTGSNGYDAAYQDISGVYILKDQITYIKNWYYGINYQSSLPADKKPVFASIQPDGTLKKVLKELLLVYADSVIVRLYKPEEIYIQIAKDYEPSKATYLEFEDGKVKEAGDLSSSFGSYYPTFLLSPSGKSTFWYEPRDGKNTLFIGNDEGEQAKELPGLGDYKPYGWFGEGYILLSKGGSELYIMAAGGQGKPLKITNYHKPATEFAGYGYGYGGL